MKAFKKLTLAVVVAIITVSANASDECKTAADIAKKVMTDRQNGVTIVEALDDVDSYLDKSVIYIVNKYDREEAELYRGRAYTEADTARRLIPIAYKMSLYHDKYYREAMINEFVNKVYLSCEKK